jgi:hypothetical protein
MSSIRSPVHDEDLEDFRLAQERTRTLRLALSVVRDQLPALFGNDADYGALDDIGNALDRAVEHELEELGTTWQYLIVRPLNPARLPPPGDLEKITAAVRTLCDFGLIINDKF